MTKKTKVADWGWDENSKGPWITAQFGGELSCCFDKIAEGDEIRADGEGGWEGRCCYPVEEDG